MALAEDLSADLGEHVMGQSDQMEPVSEDHSVRWGVASGLGLGAAADDDSRVAGTQAAEVEGMKGDLGETLRHGTVAAPTGSWPRTPSQEGQDR